MSRVNGVLSLRKSNGERKKFTAFYFSQLFFDDFSFRSSYTSFSFVAKTQDHGYVLCIDSNNNNIKK